MSKKIILLALAVASVAAFAVPATAMGAEEDVSLHAIGVPLNTNLAITGIGGATLNGATTITCTSSSGTANFTSTTTGTFTQTFLGCKEGFGVSCTSPGQASGTIVTTVLPFHLVTAVHTGTGATGPGILVTPNESGAFAHFTCGFISTTVSGNGLVGTITKPECGKSSTSSTIQFSQTSNTVQTHKTVASIDTTTGVKGHTPTEYSLEAFGGKASEVAEGSIAFGKEVLLECT
ncbi:MAG TPA: hypothetical protein VFJ61_11835 [Solirubrobacterales bacterium]|nr:hypothetical protein [Solirubrobacterales bacterium]